MPSSIDWYLSVRNGKSLPRYLSSKRVVAKKPKNLEDAWKLHSKTNGKSPAGKEEAFSLLHLKSYIAEKIISSCILCEHRCKANRNKAFGKCGIGKEARVSSAFVHLGEEAEIVPSGAVFFSGCNLKCCFCQNYGISQSPKSGSVWKPGMLAAWVEGMKNGISNVNLVGGEPTPNLHVILKSLLALDARLPIVWNSNMYMSEEAMGLLDGSVDLYLSDFKFGNDECAKDLSGAKNYFRVVSRNHLLAKGQASLLIRHLVLPGHVECCSKPILKWIRENLGPSVRINIMDQYMPEHNADGKIARRLEPKEYREVVDYAMDIGLQELGA